MSFQSLPDFIHATTQDRDEATYLIFKDSSYSYRQMENFYLKKASFLRDKTSFKEQDKVGIFLPNSVEFVIAFFGVMYARGTSVTFNIMLKTDEILYQIDHSEISVLVTSASLFKIIKPVIDQLDNLKEIIFIDDHTETEQDKKHLDFWKGINDAQPIEDYSIVQPSDVAGILYTSGTTGKPKGCMLSHSNYLANIESIRKSIQLEKDDVNCCIMPLFHVNGQLASLLATILFGSALVLEEYFKPRTFIDTLIKYKCRMFSAVPAVYSYLNNMAEYKDGVDLSFLKVCLCGAAPMKVKIFNTFEKKFQAKILEGYGLSEGTCATVLNPVDGVRKIGSIGKVMPDQEVIIIDSQGKAMKQGQIGEISIRSASVMLGYLKNKKATDEVIVDGWLRTGDLGYQDEDGYFYITGRSKEMIIRGGENIYPKELEEVLITYDGMIECAVFGVPDQKYGEKVIAAVQLLDGTPENPRAINKFLRGKLASYKQPDQILFVSDFPKTSTGKIQKFQLQQDFFGNKNLVKVLEEKIDIPFRWAYGTAMSRFFTNIKEKGAFIGSVCPSCKEIFAFPKSYCGACFTDCDEWVDLGGPCTVKTFTTIHVKFGGQPKEPPYTTAWIHAEGVHMFFLHILEVDDEKEIVKNAEVEPVLKPIEERVGSVYDIKHFVLKKRGNQ